MFKGIKRLGKELISSKNTNSSRRFVTLMAMAHFFLASFVILFIVVYLIFNLTKGKVDNDLLNLLKEILEYDFYIIFSGLGFITVDGIAEVIIQRAKAKAMGMINSQINTGEEGEIKQPVNGDM